MIDPALVEYHQHRPFGVGEDRNKADPAEIICSGSDQHRRFGVGEDRNWMASC